MNRDMRAAFNNFRRRNRRLARTGQRWARLAEKIWALEYDAGAGRRCNSGMALFDGKVWRGVRFVDLAVTDENIGRQVWTAGGLDSVADAVESAGFQPRKAV